MSVYESDFILFVLDSNYDIDLLDFYDFRVFSRLPSISVYYYFVKTWLYKLIIEIMALLTYVPEHFKPKLDIFKLFKIKI